MCAETMSGPRGARTHDAGTDGLGYDVLASGGPGRSSRTVDGEPTEIAGALAGLNT